MDTQQQATAAMEDGTFEMHRLVKALLESALNAIMNKQVDMACEGGANSCNGYPMKIGAMYVISLVIGRIPVHLIVLSY